MPDFNDLADAFADLVAAKVVARLSENDWPKVTSVSGAGVTTIGGKNTSNSSNSNYSFTMPVAEKKEERDEPAKVVIVKDERIDVLSRRDVRTLRKQFGRVDPDNAEAATTMKKPDLVRKIADFEALTGKTIEEHLKEIEAAIPDDTEDEVVEAADDESDEPLTREMALGLDLSTLKAMAHGEDIPEAKLKGLDVEAVVELIYGPEEVDETVPDDTDTDDLTVDDIKEMSIGELRELADDLVDQGAELEYDRNTSQPDLLAKILELVED